MTAFYHVGGNLPLRRGFDVFYGFINTSIDYCTRERYGVPSLYRDNKPTIEDKGMDCTDLLWREAVRLLKENRELQRERKLRRGQTSYPPSLRRRVPRPSFREGKSYTSGSCRRHEGKGPAAQTNQGYSGLPYRTSPDRQTSPGFVI